MVDGVPDQQTGCGDAGDDTKEVHVGIIRIVTGDLDRLPDGTLLDPVLVIESDRAIK
ncbi:MAG: hypothetical protein ACLQRH_20370 [Acidimicrobiales bacterium]